VIAEDMGAAYAGRVERIGAATLYLGDSSQLVAAVGPVNAVITDPPYEFSTSGGGRLRAARDNMERIAADKLDKGFDTGVLTAAVAAGADSVVVFYHYDQVFSIAEWFAASPLNRHAGCFWRKLNPMPVANRFYQPEVEYYWHGFRKPFGVNGYDLRQMKRVWEGKVGDTVYGHPTEKPIELMRKIVINASNPDDVVLDPFMGTGTTAVAALSLGRKFVGIELDPHWFDAACDRIDRWHRQGNLFGTAA